MIWHVSAAANAAGDGSRERPFQTIGEAARALSGDDTVLVSPGVYREHVNPPRGGTFSRVTFRSEINGAAIITGTEVLSFWEESGPGNAYRAFLPDVSLYGDGTVYAVFADGEKLEKATSRAVFEACAQGRYPLEMNADTPGVWYTESENDILSLFVTLDGRDPGGCEMEAALRPCSFFADGARVGNITVSGFVLYGRAGCADGSGFIFEDCEIAYAEGDALSFGDGATAQVAGHTVRRCHIRDCSGNGITVRGPARKVRVEACHIHGAESGIVFENVSDAVLLQNRIGHCANGLRLSYGAQNTVIARNLFHDNGTDTPKGCDLQFDAFAGPVTLASNLFLSGVCAEIYAHGYLFVNNLIGGIFKRRRDVRVPLHRVLPDTGFTEPFLQGAALTNQDAVITAGDAHFYRNIFLGGGTVLFGDCPEEAPSGAGLLPVHGSGNIYCNHSTARASETDALYDMRAVFVTLKETGTGETVLESNLWDGLPALKRAVCVFPVQNKTFYGGLPYADSESARIVRCDYTGAYDPSAVFAGPFMHPEEKTVVFDSRVTGEKALAEAAGRTLEETRATALRCRYALLNCAGAQAVFVRGNLAWIRTQNEGALKETDCAYGIVRTLDRWTMEADETFEAGSEEVFNLLSDAVVLLCESLRGTAKNADARRTKMTGESTSYLSPYGISMRLTANYLKFIGESTRSFLTLEEVIRTIRHRAVDYVAEVVEGSP